VAFVAGRFVMLGEIAGAADLREWHGSDLQPTATPGWIGFTPDSSALVMIQRNGLLRVAGLAPDAQVRSAPGGNPHPLAGLSRDGKTLTVWRQDRVDRWDLEKLGKTATIKFPFLGSFRRLRMRADGSLFAIHLDAGGIAFWDPAAEKEVGRLDDAKLFADEGMEFTPDGKQLVTVSRSLTATIRVWDVATGKLAWSFVIPASEAGEPVISPDGQTVVFSTLRAAITLRDLKTGKPRFDRGGLDAPAAGLTFLPSGKILAAGGRQVYIWDRATGEPLKSIELPVEPVNGLAVDAAGRFAVVACSGLLPRRCDLTTGQIAGEYALPAATLINTNGIAVTGDGRTLCAIASTGPRSRPLRLNWDAQTRQPGPRWEPSDSEVQQTSSGTYSPHSMLTGQHRVEFRPGQHPPPGTGLPSEIDRRLELHALADDTLLLRVEQAGVPERAGVGGPVLAVVSWSPAVDVGGEVSDDSAIEAWDIYTGAQLLQMRGGNWKRFGDNAQWALAAAPDGRTLALARGATIVLRDVDGGAELLKRAAGSTVRRLAFSADGRWLASAQEDGTLLTWDVSAVTRRGVARPLTADEAAACWADLGRDAKASRVAGERLAGDAARTIALARAQLKPAPAIDAARIARLIADLDSPKFAARQAATRELAILGARAAAALQAARHSSDSAELQHRLDKLLSDPFVVRSAEERRTLRAIDLLERFATPESRSILTELSRGDPTARETQAAAAALQRLAGE
jgi:WD40 repeat protein